MLNIAICDDDIQTTGRMDMLLQKIAKRNFMDVEIEVFWNGKSLADAVAKDTFVAYGKLNDIEESLKQSKVPFLRVHQSYLVNYKHVEGQAYDFVVMDNGKRISISEDRRKLIGEQYCSMEDTFYVNE